MTFGLDEKTSALILDVFKKYPAIEKVKIFGSRALERHQPQSDVDFALFGNCDPDLVGYVRADLEALSTPYLYDAVHYALLENKDLRDHIDRVGKIFYQKMT